MDNHLKKLAVMVALTAMLCLAGIRSAGKYSGVVVFDRWGGCTLYSGIYVMYVSEGAKGKLQPQAGKCVQVDATKVEQPKNPGDGLIKEFALLGPAPEAKPWESPDELKIAAASAFADGNTPEFLIRVENVSEKPQVLHMNSLAPTVLAAKAKGADRWGPSDGPSTAIITRESFWIGEDGPRMQDTNGTWQWKVLAPGRLERDVALEPKAVFELRLSFRLPAGEYEFLAGYGGGVHDGRCIASNLIGFDVKRDGTAVIVKAAAP